MKSSSQNYAHYQTIQQAVSWEIEKIKKSRFIGFAFPIQTQEDAKKILADHKKQYYDATHSCRAYNCDPRLHFDLFGQAHVESLHHKDADDGEPGGTAGYPIKMAIQGEKMHNVLVIVTRYYGGTMLGRGGLVQAYGKAAKEVLQKANKQIISFDEKLLLSFAHEDTGLAMHYIKQFNAKILQDTTTQQRVLHIAINTLQVKNAVQKIKETGKIAVKVV